MSLRTYTCEEVNIDHDQLLELRRSGKVRLGMDDDFAIRLLSEPGLGPSATTANAAGHLWNWVAFGALAYSIYLSFTWHWWAFIPGIIVMRAIYSANKTASSQNYLAAAMVDRDFYNRIRSVGGWLYNMEVEAANPYLVTSRNPQ